MGLSVIVPVYNVEKYLKKCLDSILMQTYKDYELILVNDGSTDNSSKICDEYANLNKNIKVIHKKNGGLSEARNIGLKTASKEYVFFIDSDDFLDDCKAFEKIIRRTDETKVDVLNFGFKKYYEESNKMVSYFKKEDYIFKKNYDIKQTFSYIIKNNLYIASAWNKVIRTQILQKNNLKFIEGIYSEDIEWCNRLAIYSKTFDYLNEDFYCYRQRKESISKNILSKNLLDLKDSIITCYKQIEKLDKYKKMNLLSYISYQYGTFLLCQAMVKSEDSEVNLYIDEMEKYKFLLKYSNNKKVKILYIIEKIIGYRNLCKLIRILYKLK